MKKMDIKEMKIDKLQYTRIISINPNRTYKIDDYSDDMPERLGWPDKKVYLVSDNTTKEEIDTWFTNNCLDLENEHIIEY